MPHDKLVRESPGEAWLWQSVVSKSPEGELSEQQVEIEDSECLRFCQLMDSLPEPDHIALQREIKREGNFKRVLDMFASMNPLNLRRSRERERTVFAPTKMLMLLQHLQKCFPNHMAVFADFDHFMMPRGSI